MAAGRLTMIASAIIVLSMIACERPGGSRALQSPAPVTAAPSSPRPALRAPTAPVRGKLEIIAPGGSVRFVRRAVRDLRSIDAWRALTRNLYAVRLSTRVGAAGVPSDGHLADATYTGLVDELDSGTLCDVFLFPGAIATDLRRQRRFFAAGRLGFEPPSLRSFWASIAGHELAHCSEKGQRGEARSERWERKIAAALERR